MTPAVLRVRAVLAGGALAALLAAQACGGRTPVPPPPAHVAVAPEPSPAPVPAPVPTPTPAAVASPPTRFAIPSLGIDAAVEPVTFLGVPANPADVAWFRDGPAPGAPGNAIIDGHLDWTTGPAVFWHLRDIKPGDRVTVTGQGDVALTFVVDRVEAVAVSAGPPAWLYTYSGEPQLTLITCGGSYRSLSGYDQRLLVHSVPAPAST